MALKYLHATPTASGEDRKLYIVGSGGVSTDQTVFSVSYDEGRVEAYLNGVRLFPDSDFTRTASGVGTQITLASGVGANDVLELIGWQGVHSGNGLVEDRFVVGVSSSGSGGSYTNSTTIFPVLSNTGDTVSVWRNGVKLVHTTDYTVTPASSVITLTSAAIASDEICVQVVGIVTAANFIPSADLIDEDSFSTNSATKVPSQQSTKSYIDARASVATTAAQGVGTGNSPTFVNTTLTGYLAGPASFTIDPATIGDNTGTLVIAGNLQVDGTTTTVNSTTMTVDDLNLTLASGAANSAAANGAGLTIDGASATMLYTHATTSFDFNKTVNATIGTAAQPNITSLGSLTALNVGVGGADLATFSTSSGNRELILKSTAATGNNTIAGIRWQALDSAGANTTWAGIAGVVTDNTNTGEDGALVFQTISGGTFTERMRIQEGNVGIGQSAPGALLQVSVPYARTDTTVRDALFVSSNETDGSYSGLEIRLKGGSSDATRQAYLQTATQGSSDDGHLCLQTGGGNVGIGNNNPDDSKLSISGVAAGDKGVSINHSITNTYALHIDSEAEAQHSVFIDGANTTGNIIEVNSTGNALTTGRVLHIWSNSNTTNTRSLCKIHNDNASATGATCLEIVQDSTGPALAVSGDVTINSGHLNVKGGSFAQTLLHTSLILGY